MDIELIKALTGIPLDLVLVVIIFQQQKQINLLLERICENERNHGIALSNFYMRLSGVHDLPDGKSEN